MDALLVFDPQNNVISIKCSKQFTEFLFEFVNENGFKTQKQDLNDSEVLRNLLSVLVTPFVVSQRYLIDVSNIKFDCIGDTNAVYSKSRHFFLLYIFANTENEVLMQRKVDVFSQILQFIFGPVVQSIASYSNLVQILFNLIDKWQQLSENTTFMLESIERLLISSELLKVCNNSLENILSKIRLVSKSSNEIASHIYLFYELKYITSYSSRNATKISRGDMLLMLLLSNTLDSQPNSAFSAKEELLEQIQVKRKTSFEISFSKKNFKELLINSFNKIETKYYQYLVFLKSNTDQKLLVPYVYRKLTIKGHLFAIILSEIPTQFSSNLMKLINIISVLVDESKNKKCCHTVIELENCIKRTKDYIFKNNLTKDKAYASTLHNMIKLSKCKIFEYITDLDQNLLNFQTEAQLSAINNSLRDNYKTLIFDFYNNLIPKVQSLHLNLFSEVVFYCRKTFDDYMEYFNVKNQRNMTLLGINVDIKDLIGFIYIDRTVNESIIAPIEDISYANESDRRIAFKDDSSVGSVGSVGDLKNILVNMIFDAYHSLSKGNLIQVWTDGVFQYSYVIWFEDSSGSALDSRVTRFQLESYPTIISGNFIQDIINSNFSKDNKSHRRCHESSPERSGISCYPYELFCIYNCNSVLNRVNVIQNTKKLSTKLWQIGVSSDI